MASEHLLPCTIGSSQFNYQVAKLYLFKSNGTAVNLFVFKGKKATKFSDVIPLSNHEYIYIDTLIHFIQFIGLDLFH